MRAIITAIVGVLVPLLTELLGALGVKPAPWHEKAVRLAVVALVAAGLAGTAYAGGASLDWATLAPILGDLVGPLP
jgi:hypothetical protein